MGEVPSSPRADRGKNMFGVRGQTGADNRELLLRAVDGHYHSGGHGGEVP
jgi:hypothetical protein